MQEDDELCRAENDLFTKWRAKRPTFYSDGMVDSKKWLPSFPKILLLMKEVNRPDGTSGDLRAILRTTQRRATWDVVTRWVRGIRELQRNIPWGELDPVEDEDRRKALISLVVMNLKKTPGRHTTNVRSFRRVVSQDRDEIRHQFFLYNADLVVCCGSEVTRAFKQWISPKQERRWKETLQGIGFLEYQPGKHVIDYSHPKARVAPTLLHYPLIDAIREIRPAGSERNGGDS